MKKYGVFNFVVEELYGCDNEELNSYEIQFVNKYNTYKEGYNATKGGDGKILFDYALIIEVYKLGGTIVETAAKIGCSTDTVSKVLHINNIPIKRNPYEVRIKTCINKKQKVIQLDKNSLEKILEFESMAEAAHWLVNNSYAKIYNGGVRQKISMCCKGKLKTAYSFKWKFK